MNAFYVITNTSKEIANKNAAFIKNYLESKGKICYICHNDEFIKGGRSRYTDASLIPDEVECLIALGGDGTLLHASRDTIDSGLPILGINMGTLGYLAEIELSGVTEALDRLIADDYFVEERMMIRGTVYQSGKKLMEDIALNDIVISRRGRLRVVDFDISVNDTFLCSYRADGIIVSTPTGSTGYTLSAGGPIVSPDASLILLTAIAPHSLVSRTIVLPDDVTVTVEIGSSHESAENFAEISFDGDTSLNLAIGGRVEISRTVEKTHFLKLNHTSFVTNLREKLK